MLIVLSPAKSLDYQTPLPTDLHTQPDFIPRSAQLVDILKAYSPAQIASLMRISDPLAHLNAERYAAWSPRFSRKNSRPAIFAFNGDVYEGLQAALAVRRAARLCAIARPDFIGIVRPVAAARSAAAISAGNGNTPDQSGRQGFVCILGRGRDRCPEPPAGGATRAGAGQPGVGRVFQGGAAHPAAVSGDHAGIRRLEGRPLQDHFVSRQTRARPDGALRRRAPALRGPSGCRNLPRKAMRLHRNVRMPAAGYSGAAWSREPKPAKIRNENEKSLVTRLFSCLLEASYQNFHQGAFFGPPSCVTSLFGKFSFSTRCASSRNSGKPSAS